MNVYFWITVEANYFIILRRVLGNTEKGGIARNCITHFNWAFRWICLRFPLDQPLRIGGTFLQEHVFWLSWKFLFFVKEKFFSFPGNEFNLSVFVYYFEEKIVYLSVSLFFGYLNRFWEKCWVKVLGFMLIWEKCLFEKEN